MAAATLVNVSRDLKKRPVKGHQNSASSAPWATNVPSGRSSSYGGTPRTPNGEL
jgi:hypothetical protein